MIYPTLSDTISQLRQEQLVGEARRAALQPLIDYVQAKVHAGAHQSPFYLHPQLTAQPYGTGMGADGCAIL